MTDYSPLAALHHLRLAVTNGEGLTPEAAVRTLRLIEGMDREIVARLASLPRGAGGRRQHRVDSWKLSMIMSESIGHSDTT